MNKVYRDNEVNNKTLVVFIAILFLFSAKVIAQTVPVQTDVPALKDVYKNDFYIGCLLSYRHVGFSDDPVVPGQSSVVSPTGGDLIKYHMNSISPGNNMKPQYTVDLAASTAAYNSAPDSLKDSADTHPVIKFNADITAQLNWAKRQGFTFRGHTLVWHSQTPGTAFFRTGYTADGARLSKEKMTERMGNYIKEVIRLVHENWPGLLSAYDVVNEAITDNGADRITDSEWYTTFGDNSFIMKAFEFARKYTIELGEPQIKLYYNDYSTHIASKATGIANLCSPIFRAGYLDGIGMQEHDANNSPTAEQWIATYNKFDTVCTEMAVTELDVTTGSGNPSSSVLATQANQYGQLFKCFVERSFFSGRGKIINVSKDGLNDQYTFKTNQSSSIWDSRNQCKPSFYAVANVGIYYNKLDSLISFADTVEQNNYTSESWLYFINALASAKTVMAKNYSASQSAASALIAANDTLVIALDSLTVIPSAVNDADSRVHKTFTLNQNYPNPFNPTTTISFDLPLNSSVRISLFDILGNVVKEVVNGNYNAGSHSVTLNASDLASGIYFYRIEAGKFNAAKKLILMK